MSQLVRGNFVTRSDGTTTRRGRPRKHASNAEKQKAYRAGRRAAQGKPTVTGETGIKPEDFLFILAGLSHGVVEANHPKLAE